jgi:hypothetical protein
MRYNSANVGFVEKSRSIGAPPLMTSMFPLTITTEVVKCPPGSVGARNWRRSNDLST